MDENLGATWQRLRSSAFQPQAETLIRAQNPTGKSINSIEHVRSAHYAAMNVVTGTEQWLVRIGAYTADAVVDNSGLLGTSVSPPAGQQRELDIATQFEGAGARVSVPKHYTRDGMYDLLWVPFLVADPDPISATMWGQALSDLTRLKPLVEQPVFTNHIKSMNRIATWSDGTAGQVMRERYTAEMAHLFEVASSWSVVHGDAHGANAFNVEGVAVLFDFDTACWAPSVWDLTHLLTRAGTSPDHGYTAAELVAQFPNFTAEELAAALALRETARRIAGHKG